MRIGGIEAGGTKFICAISDNDCIIKKIRIDTVSPKETMPKVIEFFKDENIDALGLATFGPINLDKSSDTYGSILLTPKEGWSHFDIYNYLKKNLNLGNVFITTDVNGACLAEVLEGESKGLSNVLYMTIGTGVGVGAVINGEILNTVTHPEMGHIFIKRRSDDNFIGSCPIHTDCLEGLVAKNAIIKRFGKSGFELRNDKKVWDLIGYYVALALYSYSCVLSPQRIIIGGGIGLNDMLIEYTRKYFYELNNSFLNNKYLNDLNNYIVHASLKEDAGIIGAILLAKINILK